MTTYHIYCDESCHGEHDGHDVMVLGSVRCPASQTRDVAVALRELKKKHGIKPAAELKWTKVSIAKVDYYKDVVDYFLNEDALAFRAVVVIGKSKLRHADYNQTHDDFYYKQNFLLLSRWIERKHDYRIFLDIKDASSWSKTQKLREILGNNFRDHEQKVIRSVELVRSEQVEQVQLADLLIGAIGYVNRGLAGNAGKLAVINQLRQRTRLSLTETTPLTEPKLNLLCFRPKDSIA